MTGLKSIVGVYMDTPRHLVKKSIEYLTRVRTKAIIRVMPDRAVKMELFDQFARVAQAMGSGRRVEIVDVLCNGDRTVEELARQVGFSTANTSQHLQVLKEAGLVAATRDGT